ncbi:MAG: hypothetical protein LPK25_01595 [Cyclobacteriaceae bacterium]|nr:hypothetical protein [Cyclobacteriaceae bacterium]
MQEDNLDKWLASSLRKAQEEAPVPYQEGAWEAFEKKRNGAKMKPLTYWISGIAASLLLLIGYGLFHYTQTHEEGSSLVLTTSELPSTEKLEENALALEENPNLEESTMQEDLSQKMAQPRRGNSSATLAQNSPKQNQRKAGQGGVESLANPQVSGNISSNPSTSNSSLAATEIEPQKNPEGSTALPISPAEEAANQAKVEELKKQIAELTGDQEEKVESNESQVALGLGINPGFGAGTQNNQNVTGSSLGLGVQMNLALSEKVSVGSGMGVNYFSQTSKGTGMVAFANAAYPTNERTEIEQVQVDLPLYITYPLTRNKTISIQAGFSNILAFNQTAQQETKYVRQVTVQDASSNFSSVSFRNESVSGFSSLDAPNAKFMPFATANLGVNIRVMESKKTSYLLMPFYNYPLQDISGTGNNIGFFGASLKVNFGPLEKK